MGTAFLANALYTDFKTWVAHLFFSPQKSSLLLSLGMCSHPDPIYMLHKTKHKALIQSLPTPPPPGFFPESFLPQSVFVHLIIIWLCIFSTYFCLKMIGIHFTAYPEAGVLKMMVIWGEGDEQANFTVHPKARVLKMMVSWGKGMSRLISLFMAGVLKTMVM